MQKENDFFDWDDIGDSQEFVDRQGEVILPKSEEELAEERMMIIMRNGNSGEHYFDYFNNHPNSADIWDDEEEQDIE